MMRKATFLGAGLLAVFMASVQTNRHNNLGAEEHLWKMKKISAHEFIAVGNSGSVVKYNDSCNDWIPLNINNSDDDFRSISFPSPATGYISGPSNALFKTTDGGASWQAITPVATGLTNASIQCVHFRNATTGFIAGSQVGVSGGGRFIKKTIDGGTTWTNVTPAGIGTTTVYDMAFFAQDTGIAVGTNNQAFRTTDNGTTWMAVPTAATVYAVAIAGTHTAVAVANNSIIRSTDRGLTWTAVTAPASGLQGIHFYDDVHGMITGASGALYYTADAGLTWAAVPTLLSQKLYDVQMTSATTAVCVGANGVALAADINQPFHRLFEEHFCHPSDSVRYTRYANTDYSGATPARKWFFTNPNEGNNGLYAAQWFPGNFAIYDASYYEDVLAQHHTDSASLETRVLNLNGVTQLSLDWNEAFYTHPDGLTRTRVEGYNGNTWLILYESTGMEFGDGVASAIFPDHKRSIDISALAGVAAARLRFSYTAPNTNDELKMFWAVSDIVISNRSTAVQLDSLMAGTAGECLPVAPQDIQVSISNTGQLPVFPIELGWSSSDGQAGVTADYGMLAAGGNTQLDLIDNFTPPAAGGIITIKAWIRKLPNQDAVNDTISRTFNFIPGNGTAALLGADTAICPGSSITLTAPAALGNITWSNGTTTGSLLVSGAGTYWISGAYGSCAVSDTIQISHLDVPLPVITQQGTLLRVTQDIYTSYTWFRNGVAIPNSDHPEIIVTQNGTYTVEAVTTQGCEVVSGAFNYNGPGTGIGSIEAEKGNIRIYPNPAQAFIILHTGGNIYGALQVKVMDAAGRLILHTAIQAQRNGQYKLDTESLVPGFYLLQVSGDRISGQLKFIRR
jgi:photosystem II stability/assembly factor-like uncharacterized protein